MKFLSTYGWNKPEEKSQKSVLANSARMMRQGKAEKEAWGSKLDEISSRASQLSLYMPPRVRDRKRKSWNEKKKGESEKGK